MEAASKIEDSSLDASAGPPTTAGPTTMNVSLRARTTRWLDRYVDPLLVFLALATVPLLIADTAHPRAADRHVISGG